MAFVGIRPIRRETADVELVPTRRRGARDACFHNRRTDRCSRRGRPFGPGAGAGETGGFPRDYRPSPGAARRGPGVRLEPAATRQRGRGRTGLPLHVQGMHSTLRRSARPRAGGGRPWRRRRGSEIFLRFSGKIGCTSFRVSELFGLTKKPGLLTGRGHALSASPRFSRPHVLGRWGHPGSCPLTHSRAAWLDLRAAH